MMIQRGFSPKWMRLIHSLLHKGSAGVRVNDINSDFFETARGVRQGEPISHILFNLAADVFTRMLMKAAKSGLITVFTRM